MDIELDLKHIQQMGQAKEDENWRFRTFLKHLDMPMADLDALVRQITADVSSQIDCTQCANCCKQIKPGLDTEDISEFAIGLRLSASELEAGYLRLRADSPSTYEFKTRPCPFLEDDRCSNYDCRPKDCRSYPHLYKDGFTSRLWGVVENYAICPIVFNVYERLKTLLWDDEEPDAIDDGGL